MMECRIEVLSVSLCGDPPFYGSHGDCFSFVTVESCVAFESCCLVCFCGLPGRLFVRYVGEARGLRVGWYQNYFVPVSRFYSCVPTNAFLVLRG